MLRRAAAAAAMRRERNSSSHSDDMGMKRHRGDNGPGTGNNNNLDVLSSHSPQVTAADFSTNIKHSNNNLSPQIKDTERLDPSKLSIGMNILYVCHN